MHRVTTVALAASVLLTSACGVAFEAGSGGGSDDATGAGGSPSGTTSATGGDPASPSATTSTTSTGGASPNLGGGGGGAGVGVGGDAEGGAPPTGCAVGQHELEQHCYQLIVETQNWDAARQDCQAIGPGWDLAAISSPAERAFLDSAEPLPSMAYIGGRDVSNSDTYEWVNGETWGFTVWGGAVEPDGGGEDCVRVVPVAGPDNDTWADNGCNTEWPRAWCEGPLP